jgi:hypothetical protein
MMVQNACERQRRPDDNDDDDDHNPTTRRHGTQHQQNSITTTTPLARHTGSWTASQASSLRHRVCCIAQICTLLLASRAPAATALQGKRCDTSPLRQLLVAFRLHRRHPRRRALGTRWRPLTTAQTLFIRPSEQKLLDFPTAPCKRQHQPSNTWTLHCARPVCAVPLVLKQCPIALRVSAAVAVLHDCRGLFARPGTPFRTFGWLATHPVALLMQARLIGGGISVAFAWASCFSGLLSYRRVVGRRAPHIESAFHTQSPDRRSLPKCLAISRSRYTPHYGALPNPGRHSSTSIAAH